MSITVTLPIEEYQRLVACAKTMPPNEAIRLKVIDLWQTKLRARGLPMKADTFRVGQDMVVAFEQAINEVLA